MTKELIKNKIDKLTPKNVEEVNLMLDKLMSSEKENPTFKLQNDSNTINSNQDLLGRKYIAMHLADIINEDIIPPFTIGVYGQWGSGKSVFLKYLADYLENQPEKNCKIIYFNAWKYESTGNIMFSLFKKIEEELPDTKRNELRKTKIKIGVVKSLLNLFAEYSKLDISNVLRFTKNQYIINALDDKYDSIKEVEKLFEGHIAEVLKYKERKILVLLIDDLDRCNPESVVIMLESIKNFLGTPNCIFVIAADKNVVTSGIQSKYNNTSTISGDDYLEKIVNYSVELKLEPKQGIVNLIDFYHQTYSSIIQKHKPEFLQFAFECLKSQNVRCAKRILDKYVIVMKDPVTPSNYDYRIILFVIILQEMLPEFYRDIKKFSNTSFIDELQRMSEPGQGTDFEKINDNQRLKYKYILKTPVKNLIFEFKRTLFPGKDVNTSEISSQVYSIINYLETHIVGL